MPRGGKRAGAGKPKGSKRASTLAKERGRDRALQLADITEQRVMLEIARLAFADTRAFFDEQGNAKAIKDLTADQGAQLAGFEVLIKNAKAGDGITDTIHKFKLWDKTRALEQLAKHFGLLVDKLEHSGKILIEWQGE